MTGLGKIAVQVGRKALKSLPAVVLVAGTGALFPLGTAAANASAMHAHHTLTVATTGTDHGNCRQSPCKTLGFDSPGRPERHHRYRPGHLLRVWQRQRRQAGSYRPQYQIHRVRGPHRD